MIDYVEKGMNCGKKMLDCDWRETKHDRTMIGYAVTEINCDNGVLRWKFQEAQHGRNS